MRVPRVVVCGWLIAAGVAAAPVVSLDARGGPPKPPALLRDLLKVETGWRILDPTIDLVGDYTIKQLEDLDRWPPWIQGDFDKDGEDDDVAAVVVRRGAGGATEFTVVVVHHRTRGRGELVVPFAPRPILGVATESFAEDTVTPQYCIECDANTWYRWNGRAYEPLLHALGETVMISGEPGRRLTLFADPRPDAARTTNLSLCVEAKVLQVGGTEGERWYRVEVDAPESPRGWIPQQLVVEPVDCLG